MSEQQKPHVLIRIDPTQDVDWARHPVSIPGSRSINFGLVKELCALDNTRGGRGFFRMAHEGTRTVRLGVYKEFTDAHADILRRWHIKQWTIETPAEAAKGRPAGGIRQALRRSLQRQ